MGIGEVECADKKPVEQLSEYSAVRDEYVRTIHFTNQAYRSIIQKLGNDYNRQFFEQLLADLTNPKLHDYAILRQSALLEKGFEIADSNNRFLCVIMRRLFENLEFENENGSVEYENISDFIKDLSLIFLSVDGQVLTPKNMNNRAGEITLLDKNKRQYLDIIITQAKIGEQILLR